MAETIAEILEDVFDTIAEDDNRCILLYDDYGEENDEFKGYHLPHGDDDFEDMMREFLLGNPQFIAPLLRAIADAQSVRDEPKKPESLPLNLN